MLETDESIPSPVSPTSSSIESVPLPVISPSVAFGEIEYITEGTHALIYKVVVADGATSKNCCLRIFRNFDGVAG